jgi:hypothetical protein
MRREIENPMVRWKEKPHKLWGRDPFGNGIWVGDDILVFDDDVYRKDDLSYDAIKILKRLGAEEKVAVEDD